MPDFLLELGLEEIPARMVPGAQAELLKRVIDMLQTNSLLDASPHTPPIAARSFSTPRRLAVHVTGVVTQQPDINVDSTGPSEKIAFKDGQYAPAAVAFAQRLGITVNDLHIADTPKGRYVTARTTRKGRTAAEVIAAELPKEIAAIYWAKNMYWRPAKPERFVRPVLWIACLLGDSVVPLAFAGKTAGRATYGHRVLHGDAPITITSPSTYLTQLESVHVLADVEARRHKIRKALDHATRRVPNSRWREDEALVDTVTHLTEWPGVLLGSFEPAFLALPEEVLVTVMRDHQKYFAVETAEESDAPRLDSETWETKNRLAPHFLAVTNISLDATNEPIIRQGNERVLKARFNDARFFWEFDQRIPLADRVKLLENVTFQKDLGSYAAKNERVRAICHALGTRVFSAELQFDFNALLDAASLAKTDLTTDLVKEFTELQGIIGGLYARSQGISTAAADAIYDQYLPASASDTIPRSAEGALLGLADRIDTLAGMFALGMEPTGSKDPFALRRAANSIVRILAESNLPLTLSEVINAAAASQKSAARLASFFAERIDFYLRESVGLRYDVVKAVMKKGSEDLRGLVARGRDVSEELGSADFLAVCVLYKRANNILMQAEFVLPDTLTMSADIQVLEQLGPNDLQVSLSNKAMRIGTRVHELCKAGQYRQALKELATLRPDMDTVLDPKTGVRVMDNDPAIRGTRLLLLAQIVNDCSEIADFSEIVTPG